MFRSLKILKISIISFFLFSCGIQGSIQSTSQQQATTSTSSPSNAILIDGNSTGSTLSLGTQDVFSMQFLTSNTARMTISSDGKVGIGTASPTKKLHVYGSGDSKMLLEGTDTQASGMMFKNTQGELGLGLGSDENFHIGTDSTNPGAGTKLTILMSNGNTGIGTTNPQATLEVNGYVKLKKNSGAPVACSATYDGSLAMTSTRSLCVCDGTNWVILLTPASTCVW